MESMTMKNGHYYMLLVKPMDPSKVLQLYQSNLSHKALLRYELYSVNKVRIKEHY